MGLRSQRRRVRARAVLLGVLGLLSVAVGTQKARGDLSDMKCDLERCGVQCFGREQCTSDCMATLGYIDAECYGAVTRCTNRHCLRYCFAGCTEKCAACSRQNCTPALASCLGTLERRIPAGCCFDTGKEDEKISKRSIWYDMFRAKGAKREA